MRFILIALILGMTACGKCAKTKRATLVSLRPAQSVPGAVYDGPCQSTYNETWSFYEMSWSDGNVGCWERVTVEREKIAPGYSEEFCEAFYE